MIRKQDYQTQVGDIRNFDEFTKFITTQLTDEETLEAGYLLGATWVSRFLNSNTSKNLTYSALCIPRNHLYTPIVFCDRLDGIQNQNLFLFGDPGVGKTFKTFNLAKQFFCWSFISPERRDSIDFFDGKYSIGYLEKPLNKNICCITEQNCLDMYSREIQGVVQAPVFDTPLGIQYSSAEMYDLYNSPLLIIQDLGGYHAHEKFARKMFSILDNRLSDLSKITYITSNAKYKQLQEIYGGPFVDRLYNLMQQMLYTGLSKRRNTTLFRGTPEIEFHYLRD